MNVSDDEAMGVYKDIQNLIKIIRVLVYDRELPIKNPKIFWSFMTLIENCSKWKKIDF